jgi:Flp pilus assembly protein TadD
MRDEIQANIQQYDKAIRRRPDDAEMYVGRGANYLFLYQNERAIVDFTEAVRLNPNAVEAYHGVAPSQWTVKDYATNPATVHLLSYASGDK